MVSSAKKKRGKARKAAKEDPLHDDGKSIRFWKGKDDSFIIEKVHENRVVKFVKDGNGPITEILANHATNLSLEKSGILSVILGFLKLCEYERFNAVVNTNNTLNIQTPLNWIRVLINAVKHEPSSSMLIAKNIGPLVRCMCDDTTRLFFRSNKHWAEGIGSFVGLIYDMIILYSIADPPKSVIVDTLLQQHEGLLTSTVQWEFWKDQRADIVEELSVLNNADFDVCHNISLMARGITTNLIYHFHHRGHSKEKIQMIGSTPLVSKDYDSTCIVSSVAGFIRRIKTEYWGEEDEDFLLILMSNEDCIDKSVIREVIDLGLNFVDNHDRAEVLIRTSSGMVQQWLSSDHRCSKPDDTRVAFAIRTGLVEMCLNFIERFHEHEFFWEGEDSTSSTSIFERIKFISEHIHDVSLHNKTAKAIRSKKDAIMKVLLHLGQNKSIATNIHWKNLFDMIMSILEVNGSYCCRCNKSLSRTEVKLCNGCGRMAYCSRACQKEDWLNGHSVTCCKSYTNETAGQFQGRYEPELPSDERATAKLKELEINVNMIQLKLFLDNAEDILRQAETLVLPLYDCVVRFDLCEYPPTVEVVDYREVFIETEEREGFESSRSKENITCDYYSYIINGELDEDGDILRLLMQRLFPHEWLTNEKKRGTRE